MEKTCSSCQKTQPIGYFSSYYIRSESKAETVEYHRTQCRACFAARYYDKRSKAFGAKITEPEATALRELWPSSRAESLASIHRDAGLKMAYRTFARFCQTGMVEKWYRGEE